MKRVSPKKSNHLKELIYLNDLKECTKQTQKSLFRSVLEPILNASAQGIVLMRCFDTKNLTGLIQRLQFSDIKVYSFSDDLKENSFDNVQKENIWEETEFIIVLAQRYSAMLVWDYSLGSKKDFCLISIMLNSKKITEVCKLIAENSMINFSSQIDNFQPDRRENETMNEALGKIVDFASETNEEVILKQVENETLEDNFKLIQRYEISSKKNRLIAHEIKNNLSVIDLYSKVIQKRIENPNEQTASSILNAVECINRSSTYINTFLLDLKSSNVAKFEPVNAEEIIKNVIELTSVKAKEKEIKILVEKVCAKKIIADKVKLSNVLINLIYNSIEAIRDKEKGRVTISAQEKENFVSILVKDNGTGIKKDIQKSIFNLDFTTKENGNGLGLYISKESMQEQNGDLNLVSSDENGTTFEVLIPKVQQERQEGGIS